MSPPSRNGKPPARQDQGGSSVSSATNVPAQGAAVNPDSETIALLQETVWLLTGIYNLQIEQLNALQDIKLRMP